MLSVASPFACSATARNGQETATRQGVQCSSGTMSEPTLLKWVFLLCGPAVRILAMTLRTARLAV